MKESGSMGSKIEQLDSFYTQNEFFKSMKKDIWHTMSDYSHSGSCQLARRWTKGKLIPNYKESEVSEIITETSKIYMMFANMLFQIHGYDDEKDKILEIFLVYEKAVNNDEG